MSWERLSQVKFRCNKSSHVHFYRSNLKGSITQNGRNGGDRHQLLKILHEAHGIVRPEKNEAKGCLRRLVGLL